MLYNTKLGSNSLQSTKRLQLFKIFVNYVFSYFYPFHLMAATAYSLSFHYLLIMHAVASCKSSCALQC